MNRAEFFVDNADLVTHSEVVLRPDPGRSLVRPFTPSDPPAYADPHYSRPQRIADRVLALGESEVCAGLDRLTRAIAGSPKKIEDYLLRRFDELNGVLIDRCSVSDPRKQLLAAYFCAEYSFEAAALFNPSIIPHPAGATLPDGRVRLLLSLRGVGEGHVSSVTFREGSWSPTHGFEIDEAEDRGIMLQLATIDGDGDDAITHLASAGDTPISQTVIFPITPSQRQGIEDMRLVLFTDDDGQRKIYGTYTAYDGRDARPELMHSTDLKTFSLRKLKGRYADGKGMAIFPRKIAGRYVMLSRQDNENIWLLTSDDIRQWNDGHQLITPEQPWEFVQLGNCGSPIEIDEGWLVLTHGVGVVRSYAIGACLLAKDDPSKVIGRMAAPLLRPTPEGAREGYVPNVIYSCGGMVHERTLLLPYGVADSITRFATVPIDALLRAMD
jgi:predicted GH43/DUF377 family glycosyl hydrolase